MATAQLAPIAKDFKIDAVPVSLIGITLPALTFALSIDRILNGVTRPFFGWVSDQIGRENTMLIAFGIEAVGIWLLGTYGQDPVLFVILSGLVFFAWGEIYSLFPSTCTDVYGTKYATTNAGLLYTAKGTASLLVPFGNVLATAAGGWKSVFLIAAVMNAAAALAAPFVLKPLRTRHDSLVANGRFGGESQMLTAALILGIFGGGSGLVTGLYLSQMGFPLYFAVIGVIPLIGCAFLKTSPVTGAVLMLLSGGVQLIAYGNGLLAWGHTAFWFISLPLVLDLIGGVLALIVATQGKAGAQRAGA